MTMFTRKQKKMLAGVVEEECEEGSGTSDESETEDEEGTTCPVELAEQELGLAVARPKMGRPCAGSKTCEKCGSTFKSSYERKEHDRFHVRTKGQKCVCGKWVITNNTDYF